MPSSTTKRDNPVLAFFGSFGLAAVILILLLLLTYFGTLEQGYSTLYDVQEDYFRSAFVIHHIDGKYPVPLAGGYLLIPLLFLNLLIGGLLRMRKGVSTLGVFIVHIGIVILFAGSFVEDQLSTKGAMQVWEPRPGDSQDTASQFQSYEEWEVAIVRPNAADGSRTEFVIPARVFDGLDADDEARCFRNELPFDLMLSDYMKNSTIDRTKGELKEIPPITVADGDNKRNVAGLRATLVEKGSGKVHPGFLWGGRSGGAMQVNLGGQPWTIGLRMQSWDLPFAVHLTKFVYEAHPGTGMPRRYSSYVKITPKSGSDVSERDVHITMNEPLREGGYTLYQSSWGPPMGAAGRRMYSGFAVVQNPSDQVPLIACIIIGLGLIIHFVRKLVLHLKNEARKRAGTDAAKAIARRAAAGSAS